MIGVLVFAKAPVAGKVKTRLAPSLGLAGAATLYAAMLADTVDSLAGFETNLWYLGEPGPSFGHRVHAQRGDTLGDRMTHAISAMCEIYEAAIVVGSDAPTLPIRAVHSAVAALQTDDVVYGPSADGGYYLVGSRTRLELKGVRWSTSHALADSEARNPGTRIEPWYDVDTPADLTLLQAHLSVDRNAAPRTAAVLASSSV